MHAMQLFIPITKVDVEKRLVHGILSAESPDQAGEIMDYATGKPQFEKWIADTEARSGGKSKGNLRAMHTNIAAGKFTDIVFDDAAKTISGVAKVVDDNEWQKVLEGVYTGFSIGGSYANTWKDPKNPKLTRFTPVLSETSLVDNPCLGRATFEVVKADGTIQIMKFKTAVSATNPKETPVIDKDMLRKNAGKTIQQGWMTKDATFFPKRDDALDYDVDQEVIALEKAAEAEALKAGNIEKGISLPDGSFPISDKADLSKAIKTLRKETDVEKAKTLFQHLVKRAGELQLVDELPATLEMAVKKTPADFKKGLHEIGRIACLLQELTWLHDSMEFSIALGDADAAPTADAVKETIMTLANALRMIVEKETADLVAAPEAEVAEVMTLAADLSADDADAVKKFFGDKINEPLGKALDTAIAKAGARRSKADMELGKDLHSKMKGLQDHMDKGKDMMGDCMKLHKELGFDESDDENANDDEPGDKDKKTPKGKEDPKDDKDVEKAVADAVSKVMEEVNEKLSKASQDNADALTKALAEQAEKHASELAAVAAEKEDLGKRLKVLEDQPMPPKGVKVNLMNKAHESLKSETETVESLPKPVFAQSPADMRGAITRR